VWHRRAVVHTTVEKTLLRGAEGGARSTRKVPVRVSKGTTGAAAAPAETESSDGGQGAHTGQPHTAAAASMAPACLASL
jgi:hypothetical protein